MIGGGRRHIIAPGIKKLSASEQRVKGVYGRVDKKTQLEGENQHGRWW